MSVQSKAIVMLVLVVVALGAYLDCAMSLAGCDNKCRYRDRRIFHWCSDDQCMVLVDFTCALCEGAGQCLDRGDPTWLLSDCRINVIGNERTLYTTGCLTQVCSCSGTPSPGYDSIAVVEAANPPAGQGESNPVIGTYCYLSSGS